MILGHALAGGERQGASALHERLDSQCLPVEKRDLIDHDGFTRIEEAVQEGLQVLWRDHGSTAVGQAADIFGRHDDPDVSTNE